MGFCVKHKLIQGQNIFLVVFVTEQKKKILEGFAKEKAFHLISLGRVFPSNFIEGRVASCANTAPFFKRFKDFPAPLLVFFVASESVEYEERFDSFRSEKIVGIILMDVDIWVGLISNRSFACEITPTQQVI